MTAFLSFFINPQIRLQCKNDDSYGICCIYSLLLSSVKFWDLYDKMDHIMFYILCRVSSEAVTIYGINDKSCMTRVICVIVCCMTWVRHVCVFTTFAYKHFFPLDLRTPVLCFFFKARKNKSVVFTMLRTVHQWPIVTLMTAISCNNLMTAHQWPILTWI